MRVFRRISFFLIWVLDCDDHTKPLPPTLDKLSLKKLPSSIPTAVDNNVSHRHRIPLVSFPAVSSLARSCSLLATLVMFTLSQLLRSHLRKFPHNVKYINSLSPPSIPPPLNSSVSIHPPSSSSDMLDSSKNESSVLPEHS